MVVAAAWGGTLAAFVPLFALAGHDAVLVAIIPVGLTAFYFGALAGLVSAAAGMGGFAAVMMAAGLSPGSLAGPALVDLLPVVAVALGIGQVRRILVELWTARGEAEQRGRWFRALISNASDVFIVHDETGAIRWVSPSVTRWIHASPADVVGRNVLDFVPSAEVEEGKRTLRDVLAAPGEPVRRQMHVQDPDGSIHDVEFVSTNLLLDPAVKGIVIIARDTTERMAAELQARQTHERAAELRVAREMERFRAELLNTAAHHLATPLTPLLVQADLLGAGRLGAVNEPQRAALMLIQRNLGVLAKSIEDIALSARLLGEPKLAGRAFDLGQLVAEMADDLAHRAAERGITLTIDAPRAARVDGEARLLQAALRHLVDNAVRYTPRGGHVRVRLWADSHHAGIVVEDDGPGMTADQIAGMMRRFGPAGKEGAGLGVFLARRVMELHGGELRLTSPGPGRGVRAELVLPLAAPPSPTQSQHAPPPFATTSPV